MGLVGCEIDVGDGGWEAPFAGGPTFTATVRLLIKGAPFGLMGLGVPAELSVWDGLGGTPGRTCSTLDLMGLGGVLASLFDMAPFSGARAPFAGAP